MCNICGKSLQYLKQKAAQDAVAEFQKAHPDPSESKPMDVQQPGLAQPEQQAVIDESKLQELKDEKDQLEKDNKIQKKIAKNIVKEFTHMQSNLS